MAEEGEEIEDSVTTVIEKKIAPPSIEKQKLFLLEFIVEDVNLDYCTTKQLVCYGEGPTVLEFAFLDMGPFTIREDAFTPVTKHYLEGCTGTGTLKSGKSVLFGLTPKQITDARTRITLLCEVFKKTANKSYSLGLVIVPLINLFNDLVESVEAGGEKYYTRNIKDCFKIKSVPENELIGHIFAYIRISCFNELVVNKFNRVPNMELDYQAEAGYYNYKYNKSNEKSKDKALPCECGAASESGECKCPKGPADNCPEIWTDNECPYDCPPHVRPCETCPEICRANKQAGKMRQRTPKPVPQPSKSKSGASKKSEKTKKGKKK